MEELKPCPFCGSGDIDLIMGGHPRCSTCGGTQDLIPEDHAVEEWNKRYCQLCEELKEVAEKAKDTMDVSPITQVKMNRLHKDGYKTVGLVLEHDDGTVAIVNETCIRIPKERFMRLMNEGV